jgi:hypothetical protein
MGRGANRKIIDRHVSDAFARLGRLVLEFEDMDEK